MHKLKHSMTTILGGLVGVTMTLHAYGITIGHFGKADIIQLIGGLAAAALGIFAADASTVNNTATAIAALQRSNNKEK